MNKAVFLDRDGVINEDHGYVFQPRNFDFIDGIFEACRHFQQLGYLLVVVTNQSGIARGMYSEAQFSELSAWMCERFREQGVEISGIYHCPHHPDYGAPTERDCSCRKPAPGLLLQACQELNIDPALSLMLGDKASDMQAAAAAGIGQKILVRSGQALNEKVESLADEVWPSAHAALQRVQ